MKQKKYRAWQNYVITYVDITSTSECSFELDLRKCTKIEKKKEERKIIPITLYISNRRKMSKYISAVGYSRLLILSLCLFFYLLRLRPVCSLSMII